jgi:hypothetical protein
MLYLTTTLVLFSNLAATAAVLPYTYNKDPETAPNTVHGPFLPDSVASFFFADSKSADGRWAHPTDSTAQAAPPPRVVTVSTGVQHYASYYAPTTVAAGQVVPSSIYVD